MSGGFACESARNRRLAVRGLDLHVLEWGPPAGTGVLLLHGGAAHAHWFDAVATALGDGRHVAALDQRGHGESAWARPPAYATEDFAGDVVGVLDALGWESAVLIGHSMGGHNAIGCAAWHPGRVRALVIVDSRPAIPPERLDQMKERGARPHRRHATVEAAAAAFRLLPPETRAYLRRQIAAGLGGPDGMAVRQTIMEDNPGKVKLQVNGRYPDGVPLTTMPPSVLAQLPRLPDDLEYRFIGDRLILLDVHAQLVVDFMDAAIPK